MAESSVDEKGWAPEAVASPASCQLDFPCRLPIAREKAELGLFVTLAEPSKPMETEAVKEGFYASPTTGAEFSKIQILTIKGLLDGSERPRYPDLAQGGHTFKKARREQGKADQSKLF